MGTSRTSWLYGADSFHSRPSWTVSAQIAGTLTSQGISILSAQLNTRDDAVVIDTFQVSDEQGQAIVDAEVWRRVDRLLAGVISGERDLEEILASCQKGSR